MSNYTLDRVDDQNFTLRLDWTGDVKRSSSAGGLNKIADASLNGAEGVVSEVGDHPVTVVVEADDQGNLVAASDTPTVEVTNRYFSREGTLRIKKHV